MTTPDVVAMAGKDAPFLARLHATSFPAPWSAEDFDLFLRQKEVFGWMVRADDTGGFILIRAVMDEAEIMTLAVDPAVRRRALGRALLEKALDELRARGVATVHLEVAVQNAPAIGLYRTFGFMVSGKRRNYYQENGEGPGADATVMRLDL